MNSSSDEPAARLRGIVVEMHDGRRIAVPAEDASALLDRAAAAIAQHYLSSTTDRLIDDALNDPHPNPDA